MSNAAQYRSLSQQVHRMFHPDRWRARDILSTVMATELKRALEEAGDDLDAPEPKLQVATRREVRTLHSVSASMTRTSWIDVHDRIIVHFNPDALITIPHCPGTPKVETIDVRSELGPGESNDEGLRPPTRAKHPQNNCGNK
ncbi:hypothetical protein B0H14DRAFT_3134517 [Mycena olivaceomarginata]|nr:hypothetical protein B0H14DRAFT_3134517 [Mycena olivaceomarginata]